MAGKGGGGGRDPVSGDLRGLRGPGNAISRPIPARCCGTAPRGAARPGAGRAEPLPGRASRGQPQLPAPHGRRGLVGLRRGGKETKIKKRLPEPAPGNE